jgi:NitT/TauT family transport system ATP-binding protein
MRSRVALARSLVGEPDVLLMDEPFSRLDAQTRATMHGELLRIHGLHGVSILFVTHDVEEAVVLADHIVLLSARPGEVRRLVDVPLPQPRAGKAEAMSLTASLRAEITSLSSQQEALP